MKHIKKKFYQQKDFNGIINPNTTEKYISVGNGFDPKLLKGKEKQLAILHTTENKLIGGAIHNVNGRVLIFPLPDTTLIYFHCAQQNYSKIEETKKKLLDSLDLTIPVDEIAINEYFQFYSLSSGFVIFLFTAIESFINQQIPENFNYIYETNKRTEKYNKTQIQESIDFKTKLTKIIPQITNKNFFSNPTALNQHIWKLKEFRDSLIHSKELDPVLPYNHIIKFSLNFNYEKTLIAVAKFMNHYKRDYVVECDCGEDF